MQAITWLICVAQVVFWPTHSNKMWILSYIFIWIKTRPPNTTMCPCTPTHHGIPHWKGVLRCFEKCPSILIPSQEENKDTTNMFTTIFFHVYRNYHVVLCMVDVHMKITQHVLCVTQCLALILMKKYAY